MAPLRDLAALRCYCTLGRQTDTSRSSKTTIIMTMATMTMTITRTINISHLSAKTRKGGLGHDNLISMQVIIAVALPGGFLNLLTEWGCECGWCVPWLRLHLPHLTNDCPFPTICIICNRYLLPSNLHWCSLSPSSYILETGYKSRLSVQRTGDAVWKISGVASWSSIMSPVRVHHC